VRNLQQFTQTLQASDGQIRQFNQQLAQVASDLAAERGDLGAALNQLSITLDKVSGFIKANASRFHTDIRGLEDVTNVLVKEKGSLNETLAVAPIALANITHAYDPSTGVIATRGNLVSLTDVNLQSTVTNLLCGLLQKSLGSLSGTLAKQCAGQSTVSGATTAPNTPGIGIPGLIGGGG
jgi:phospholipid/cholesterol/gamma-HCH transport system substrate-binding protein